MLAFDTLPSPLQSSTRQLWDSWLDNANQDQQHALATWLDKDPTRLLQLTKVWCCSHFFAATACTYPQTLIELIESGLLHQSLSLDDFRLRLASQLAACTTDKMLDRSLRLFRRQMMMRILWRDFTRLAATAETTHDMSYLAEVVVQQALDFHHRLLTPIWGQPIGQESGKPQQLLVLGMGKLGGYELNVSSDIDLIFVYPERGDTQGGRREVSNQEFFIKLGQNLIRSLDAQTVDGFVFRVDMRLRPYGESGALALNFGSMEEYYQTQGREWERYAMIKARVIAGPEDDARELMQLLRPFTYRRYVDFSAVEALREMKGLINREVARTGKSGNIKLGAGGIREIEFIVQAFQLIRGGRDERLQNREVQTLLPLLETEGYLPANTAQRLLAAYRFLRDTEHAIQGYKDKQTQALPVDDLELLRLAFTLGFTSWQDCLNTLDQHRQLVSTEFQAVVADTQEQNPQELDGLASWRALWLDPLAADQLTEALIAQGFEGDTATAAAQQILALKNSRPLLAMQTEGRARLDAFMPRLLHQLTIDKQCIETLKRLFTLVESIARRSAYILLLVENPNALQQLVALCSASPWIADQLARHPALLDELLDSRSLYSPPDRDALQDELRQLMLRIDPEDLEGQMETLRYFKLAHGLRVAAAEITDVLPLMRVSDYLTWIAEVILEHVQWVAWQQMISRHGNPGVAEGQLAPQFIIVGYGKLGGIELGHNSDLDLVFLHDADSNTYTDGDKSIDNQSFFTRMGQKIIHLLNTRTASGQLYDVDMRLRPSGNSGLLVSSFNAFEKYQRHEAWTWEHQALVRTRVVAGGNRLAESFSQLRQQLLAQPRDVAKLREDVVAMRVKMRDHLGTKGAAEEKATKFHLKQDSGGIVDIEFMVQYAVLAWAHQQPSLTRWSDNIRILESLEQADLLSAQNVAQLTEAYKAYRSAGHRLALQRLPGTVSSQDFADQRANVQRVWQILLGDQAAT